MDQIKLMKMMKEAGKLLEKAEMLTNQIDMNLSKHFKKVA